MLCSSRSITLGGAFGVHLHYRAADDFRDLRNDAIAEASKAVHSAGNPISHSTHVGFNAPPAIRSTASGNVLSGDFPLAISVSGLAPRFQSLLDGVGQIRAATASGIPKPLPFRCFAFSRSRRACHVSNDSLSFATIASGVGHNPDSVPTVRGTNGGSRYAMPFRIKPERGQVSENSAKAPSKQRCDVFHDDVSRAKLANNSGVLAP